MQGSFVFATTAGAIGLFSLARIGVFGTSEVEIANDARIIGIKNGLLFSKAIYQPSDIYVPVCSTSIFPQKFIRKSETRGGIFDMSSKDYSDPINMQKALQDKLDKFVTNYMLKANPRETNILPAYAAAFRAEAIVVPADYPLQFIYLDVECNNFIKHMAAPGETRPENFMPEVIELPVVSDSGMPVARSFVKPRFNELQPSILTFCHLSNDDFKDAITFEEAFLKFARHKLSFDMSSCLVTEGDFDVQAIIVELLRLDRASTIFAQLQKEFPQHPQLQNKENLPEKQFVWKTMSRMLRYINFKDEFARLYEPNKDRSVNDFDYELKTLGLSFEPGMHPHVGLDDTIMLQRAHKHFVKEQQLPAKWIKQIEIKF